MTHRCFGCGKVWRFSRSIVDHYLGTKRCFIELVKEARFVSPENCANLKYEQRRELIADVFEILFVRDFKRIWAPRHSGLDQFFFGGDRK